jgi:hypothetical protein
LRRKRTPGGELATAINCPLGDGSRTESLGEGAVYKVAYHENELSERYHDEATMELSEELVGRDSR